jgi:hypothetical protein
MFISVVTRLRVRQLGLCSRHGEEHFPITTLYIPALILTPQSNPAPICTTLSKPALILTEGFSLEVKLQGREVTGWYVSRAQVSNLWSSTSSPPIRHQIAMFY